MLWIIIAVITAIIMVGIVVTLLIQKNIATPESTQTEVQPSLTEQQLDEIVSTIPSSEDDFNQLIDEDLVKQPIPDDPALLKDELGQLNEIQSQLNEQKKLLEQQHQDADQLIELKEQQLKALEEQLKATS